MDEDKLAEHELTVATERVERAEDFLERLPDFPPNVVQIVILLSYDDGRKLGLELKPQP